MKVTLVIIINMMERMIMVIVIKVIINMLAIS